MSAALLLCLFPAAHADLLKATQQQGAVHAFLVVRDEGGKIIGTGDEVNVRAGSTWRSRLTLRFHDGSVDDEMAVFSEHTNIQLLTDHHVQKGPSFPKPLDMTINVPKKTVTWREVKDGKAEVHTDAVDVPTDTANGLLPLIMQNIPRGVEELKMAYVAATPKPRVVKLAIHPDGQDRFTVGGGGREATKFRVHVELGGLAGMVAPIMGKEPPDLYLWVVQGEVPTFLRLNGFLYVGGPIVSIELSAPTWPSATAR